CARHNFDYW
nr:immunoglobulin heavy chain junction region [Mus musculus]